MTTSPWPVPKFHFSVDFGDGKPEVSFQEVSGLDTESQPIEYRSGNSAVFSTVNSPNILKQGNVTLKKGIFPKEGGFMDWFSAIQMNTIQRQTVTIKLLDETGQPTMTWTLSNAYPFKITATDLKSDGYEVAVESLELSHEGLSVKNG